MASILDPQNTRRPTITPVGDAAAATAKAAISKPVPAAAQLATPPALPAPSNFVADAAGNVQANTPSANWRSAPGAQRTFFPSKPGQPIGNAAQRLASVPDLPTSLGAGAPPGTIDPGVAASRGTVIPPSPTGGSTLSLAQPAATPPLALEPQPLTAKMITPGPMPAAAAPTGEDISSSFAKRTAAARGGVDAGGAPRGVPNPVIEPAAAVEPIAAAPKAPLATRAGQALRGTANVAGRATRLGAAPVETLPRGKLGLTPKTAPGQRGGAAAMLAGVAIPTALSSLNTDTNDYRERLGMDTGPGQTALGDAFARTAGVVSDLGAAIPDSLINLANATGHTDIRPFASMFADKADQYKPHYATDAPGFITPVSPGSVTGADAQQNDTFQRQQLRQEIADRQAQLGEGGTGGGAPAPAAAAPGTAATQLASAPAPEQAGATATPPQAQPTGTAEINGRQLSAAEIADAGKRLNTVPSTAFTNPGIGTINGSQGLSSEQAIGQRMNDLRQSRAAAQLAAAPGSSDGTDTDTGKVQGKLMSQITDALRNGKKATAKLLIEQLSTFGSLANARADTAMRGRQPVKTAAEVSKENADAQLAQSLATQGDISVKQAQQIASIQQQLTVETDPAKRKTLQQDLLSLSGKSPVSAKDRLMTLTATVGTGLDAHKVEIPYDPETKQYQIPDGFLELNGLLGSQPQAKK